MIHPFKMWPNEWLWFFFFPILNGQFVLDNYTSTCSIFGSTFLRKTWEVTYGDFKMILNVCDHIPNGACSQHKSKLCIKSSKNESVIIEGDSFQNGTNEELILNTHKQCYVSIQLSCSNQVMEKPRLLKSGECEFRISMMTVDCVPKCMINYRGHLINLRSLKQTYQVHSGEFNFSIALCDSNPDCKEDGISSCYITDGVHPISSIQNEEFIFREDRKEIQFRGGYKGENGKKQKFEVLLKCNWTLARPHIIYTVPKQQGQRFSFQMETKDGCVKIPPNCVYTDKFYLYDVTNLYKNNGYWTVEGLPGHKMILNICGLLKMDEDNRCATSSSQICNIHGESYTNRGSFHQDLVVLNKRVSISLTDGDFCGNSSTKLLRTEIEFVCSSSEQNPKFLKEEDCITYLIWATPSACPKIIQANCDHKHSDIHNNCTYETYEKFYDLNILYNKDKYIVKDTHNSDLEYSLNVCGSFFDEEAPCIEDAMVVLKNTSEVNLRYRTKSYGTLKNIFENAKSQLVFETHGGANCGNETNIIYCNSSVYFECSKYEEGPKLFNKSEYTLNFLWRTPVACPNFKNSTHCMFENPFHGYSVDFARLKKTDLRIILNDITYFFDLCENNSSKCATANCKYISLNKTIVTYGNETCLEVNLDKPCNSSENEFNKTIFELTCDKIVHNEHFKMRYIKNCILILELKTDLACDKKPVIELDEISFNNTEYIVRNSDDDREGNNEHVPHGFLTHELHTEHNCSIMNPNTGYQFEISSLNLNLTSPKCPKIIFNKIESFVSLVFDSGKVCRKTSADPNTFQYIVILACQSESHDNPRMTEEMPKNNECLQNIVLRKLEACRLLDDTILIDSQKLSSGSVAGITIAVIILFVAVIGSTVYVLKFRSRCESTYDSITYEKNADL